MIRMMKVRCCPSNIAVRSLLIGQLFLVTLSWLLIGQLFLEYDVILAVFSLDSKQSTCTYFIH